MTQITHLPLIRVYFASFEDWNVKIHHENSRPQKTLGKYIRDQRP